MSAFYLTLIAVLLSGLGGRDQLTLAALTRRQGPRIGVIATACVLAICTSAFAAYAASRMLTILPLQARPILEAIALAFAGLESLILSPKADPREPTRSLGALALVLLAHQLTDAARFTLFGLAVGTGSPLAAGLGGGLASLVLSFTAIAFAHRVGMRDLRITRRVIGGLLLAIAVAMFLHVRGLL